jgi:hypothetical protein
VANVTVSVPHQLTREEAKRRIQENIRQAEQQHGGMLGTIEQRWTGDRLDFAVSPAGQRVAGFATVDDKEVHLEVVLPGLLGLLAGTVRERLGGTVRGLLARKP